MLAQLFTDDGVAVDPSRPDCVLHGYDAGDACNPAEFFDLYLDASRLQHGDVLGEYAAHNPQEDECSEEGASRKHHLQRSAKLYYADRTSPRPSYSDWQMLRPIITEMYKHSTARMIVANIQSEGFHVTYVVINVLFLLSN